jgi:hypothetical protein
VTGRIYKVTGLPNLEVRLAYVDWENGDRELRRLPGSSLAVVLNRLAKGTHISVSPHGNDLKWMELWLSRITYRHPKIAWSNPRQATTKDLNNASAGHCYEGMSSSIRQ